MKPGHTYWSQGPIVERHIATSIASPADVLRVSSRILAPLINSYCIQTVTRRKQTYINFHGFFDDAWDADRTLSKNRYSTRRNQRTIREKTVISHDFFRCFGHRGSKDLDSLQGRRFLRVRECFARESAMLNSKREEKIGRVKRSGVGGEGREEETPAVTRRKQTYINFHGFFDDAWDADRTLSKNRYSTRRNQRTIREKTVISHDFFRCFGHRGSKDLDSMQGGRFLRACECSARESAMLKLEKRGENGASQKGRGTGRGERRENACPKTLWKWETLGKISRAWPLFRKWIVDQSTHRVQRRCVCR